MNPCLNWEGKLKSTGYGYIMINGKAEYAHRFFYSLFNGEIPKGMFVCHTCDNPQCVNPDHLFLGTPRDNINDSVRKGRWTQTFPDQKGENHSQAKLTWRQVDEIRRRCNAGEKKGNIAKDYGVLREAISKIANGKRWVMSKQTDENIDCED